MAEKRKKVLGEERRELILQWLLQSTTPITGNELAERTNVSRQVIVQDISILKARNHSILATAQGYMYLKYQGEEQVLKRRIACQHRPEETEQELMILVDHGVTVKDVMVEHPIYGDLTASLMLSNRRDVHLFLTKMKSTNASLLSELTDGVHLHTIEAETNEQLDDATNALKQAGFLLSITE